MTTRERDIEKYLVGRVKALGGEVRKVKWIGRNGAPDRLVMLPAVPTRPSALIDNQDGTSTYQTLRVGHPGRTIWVELKAPGKLATFPADAHERAQRREHERMRRMGQQVEVVDSFGGVDVLLGRPGGEIKK